MATRVNLFKEPYSDVSILSRLDTDYYPSDAVPDNRKEIIQIEVNNTSEDEFIDLNSTEVLMKLRVQNTINDSPIATTLATAKIGVCHNFGHSMFRQITIQEGDVNMNPSTGTYPYQVDFENMLNLTLDEYYGRGRLEGYILDTSTSQAKTALYPNGTNVGIEDGSKLFDNGAVVMVILKPHLGPLAQQRFLLPKTRVIFKFTPNTDDFLLTHADDAAIKTYGMYIKVIKLRIRTVKLSHQSISKIYKNLRIQHAIYPTPIPSLSTHTIENGLRNWEKDNIFSGKVPKLLMFAIVKNAAFNGSRSENPFYYRTLNIKEVGLFMNGDPIIPTIYTNFANNNFEEAYLQLMNATANSCHLMYHQQWEVNNLWVIDLSPGGRNALNEYIPARDGNLRIELKFANATADGPYTIIFYGLMDSISEIDADNNVYKNW